MSIPNNPLPAAASNNALPDPHAPQPKSELTASKVITYTLLSPILVPALVVFGAQGLFKCATGELSLTKNSDQAALKNRLVSHQGNAKFTGEILCPASNCVSQNLNLQQAKNGVTKQEKIDSYVNEQLKTVNTNAQKVTVQSSTSQKYLDEGVCFGMVVGMANRMIKAEERNPDQHVEQRLIESAQKYQDGAHASAVANQLFYRNMPDNSVKEVATHMIFRQAHTHAGLREDPKTLLILYNQVATKPNQIKSTEYKQELATKIDEATSWYANQTDQDAKDLKLLVDHLPEVFTRQGVNEKKCAELGIKPELVRALHTLRAMQTQIRSDSPVYQRRYRPPKHFFTAERDVQVDFRMAEVKRMLSAQHNAIVGDIRSDKVANARDLELANLESDFGVSGERPDEGYLVSRLDRVTDGYYELMLHTGENLHSALLIKKNDTFYIWDPREGYGLMRMGKVDPAQANPYGAVQNNIRAYLYTYEDAGYRARRDDHRLQLRKFERKRREAAAAA